MDFKDWLRHPWRCIGCVIYGRLHADCPIPFMVTDYGREAFQANRSAVSPKHARPGRDSDVRGDRLQDLGAGGWPAGRLQGARLSDDTIDFPAPRSLT